MIVFNKIFCHVYANYSFFSLSSVCSRDFTRVHTFSYAEAFSFLCRAAACNTLDFSAWTFWWPPLLSKLWRLFINIMRLCSCVFAACAGVPQGGRCLHWGL